jgi:uncharacterized radical SAM protein YgiQ
MISKIGSNFDIIIITAEYYEDHPLSPSGVLARVLEASGFSVGIIEKPQNKEDITRLGDPNLAFCVTAGSIDSMLNNYTPLKKKRLKDKYSNATKMPDRAIIVYCNLIKEQFKKTKIIIGGIESSLRRFAHYDYWSNSIRKSILYDSRADILVYGNGEKQIIEIAKRIKECEDLDNIKGTCVIKKEIDNTFELLPSFKDVKSDKLMFCQMQSLFSPYKNLAQEYDNNYLVQYAYPQYLTKDLDWIYSLPYSRNLSKGSLLKMAQFSIVTHRGCFGRCNFCSIAFHQGDKIISRSEENILNEIKQITVHPDFKGEIDDLGGPSANMYGMDCNIHQNNYPCLKSCIDCPLLDKSHKKLISLMKKAREISGVKRVFVRSGIRYDLALESKDYIKELSEHHIAGSLKIAPEHFSKPVLSLMNKDNTRFEEFLNYFKKLNDPKKQHLKYYFMICHPGDSEAETIALKKRLESLENIESFQVFTPTPMTNSTCMYWTGLNPKTLEKIEIIYDYNTKKKLKRILLESINKTNEKFYVPKKKS